MTTPRYPELESHVSLTGLLGYLNLSDGRPDPRWQRQLNDAYAFLAGRGSGPPWLALVGWLGASLDRLHQEGTAAFRDVGQARVVLAAGAQVLPAYRLHHRDLLAHLQDQELFQPFFLARVFEAVLTQLARELAQDRSPSPEDAGSIDRLVRAALAQLNDYVGHRPIALLETRPQGEPYEHERHRPVPAWIRGAGAAWGPWQEIVQRALEILAETDPDLLAEAQLDLRVLEEVAVDMRAYDYSHPVNRRPNYVYGEWDPHHLDGQGRFCRYIVRKVMLEALMDRISHPGGLGHDEAVWEGAAVLAGTFLMAAGVSGAGPTAHSSSTSLATLLPRIARRRDLFYEQLLARMAGQHAARLRQELAVTRQPFGAVRQHLNSYLARHRASQLQFRFLAVLYAEMGYPAESTEAAHRIPAVSARITSKILGQLVSAELEIEHGKLADGARRLPEVEDLLQRGIACGGLPDPWNILGFQGLFPLSSAREDSVRDQRLDELIHVIERIFQLYSRLAREMTCHGEEAVRRQAAGVMDRLEHLASWWDTFATAEVGDVRHVLGREAVASARQVARVLEEWRSRGEEAADLAFWKRQVASFHSPKAFSVLVDTLLRRLDYQASLGLLISWVGQADQVPLEEGTHSFHTLVLRWLLSLTQGSPAAGGGPGPRPLTRAQRRQLIVRLMAYLEANAEESWEVPSLDEGAPGHEGEEEPGDSLYDAAYDEMTYRDSTGSQEGAVSEGAISSGDFPLEHQAEPLERGLRFQMTIARLWLIAARYFLEADAGAQQDQESPPSARADGLEGSPIDPWLSAARNKRDRLLALLDAIHHQKVPEAGADQETIIEFERRRGLKEQLVFAAIGACLDVELAIRWMEASSAEMLPLPAAGGLVGQEVDLSRWITELELALFRGDRALASRLLPRFLEAFRTQPLLYTPLDNGGHPRQILQVRLAQTALRSLLTNIPRLGLLRDTFEVLRAARDMERAQPMTTQGFTEFNQFFQAGFQSLIETVVESALSWLPADQLDERLVGLLEEVTGPFLSLWVQHSRTLQISILETVADEDGWQRLRDFIQRYGADLFHARFMTLASLRGVLHQGAGVFLTHLRDNVDPLHPVRLVEELDAGISSADADKLLTVCLRAVAENYEEYKDYNTTTTQSDYGENLHILLEFLRLKSGYDRHSWQMRPLFLAHEVLARKGLATTASLWQETISRHTRETAVMYLDHLSELEQKWSIRLTTIRDRLSERFLRPLALDRLCALVEPCMAVAHRRATADTPEQDRPEELVRFQEEVDLFAVSPAGVGLDVPYWLRRLEMEVHRVQAAHTTVASLAEALFRVPRVSLSHEDVQEQMARWDQPWPPTSPES